jgi:hypothetical protein
MDGLPPANFGKKRGETMRSLAMLIVAAAFFAVASSGLPAAQAAEQRAKQDQDQWRYTFHNGEWWYWLPANRWVYWRDSRWNDYDPQTFTYSSGVRIMPAGQITSSNGAQTELNGDIRPYYGHAEAGLDRRPLERNGEVGPFYGHTLPSEVFGRARRNIRPYYGHAVSDGD